MQRPPGRRARRQLQLEPLELRRLLAIDLANAELPEENGAENVALPARFDFGTASSPVAAGYTAVPGSTYSSGQGFGWSRSVSKRDRGAPDDLRRDLNFTSNATFQVDLANGDYDVTLLIGDNNYDYRNQQIALEGVVVDTLSTQAGDIQERSYSVTVNDGQLSVTLGGNGRNVALGALEIGSASAAAESLSVSIAAASINEDTGTSSATVTRTGPTGSSLAVALSSSNPTTGATVPNTVTIQAGSSSANFTVSAAPDTVVDGTQNVTISASAAGFTGGSDTLDVFDNDTESLSVSIAAASINEDTGTSSATVTRTGPTGSSLTVALSSSNPTTGATVPNTVTIQAGASSANFTVSAAPDTVVDGTQNVTISASAAGFTGGSDTLDVFDNDTESLSVSIAAASINEDTGTSSATVTRTGPTGSSLTVALSSSNPTTGATVPNTVTIQAGASSANFMVSAAPDTVVDGTQNVTISASAAGFTGGSDTLDVFDNDSESLAVSIAAASINEDTGTSSATVTRTGPTGSSLTVALSSSNPTTGATVPNTVTIQAGSSSANFTVSAAPDTVVDGTQNVTISASASGFTGGSDTLDVFDNDTPPTSGFSAQFDFGTTSSPVAGGYTPIAATSYSASAGHGWLNRVSTRDRGAPDDLRRDINLTSNGTFAVDVPNGSYLVSVTIGDNNYDYRNQQISLEGTLVDTLTTSAGGFVTNQYQVAVNDGQLSLLLGGNGRNVGISVLEVDALATSESLTLQISEDSIDEDTGTSNATVTRTGSTSAPLEVDLSSSDPITGATVPASVTILAGQSSATFQVSAAADNIADGEQTVTITATAGALSSSDTIDVTDNEVATLTVAIAAASIGEDNGSSSATVTRNTPTSGALVVALNSSNTTTGATVPATVTIPAGQASASFTVSATPDSVVDGTQVVTVTGSAAGFVSGNDSISVTDNDSATNFVQVVINYVDDPGEGFFDATLGAARRAAMEFAADAWSAVLLANYPGETITVDAGMRTMGSTTLGSAGAEAIYRNFSGAPVSNIWYAVALANHLAGTDLNGSDAEIGVELNSAYANWYMGLDGNTPGNLIDFATVAIHEIGHGLNFIRLIQSSGAYSVGNAPGISETFIEIGDSTPGLTPGTNLTDMTMSQRATAVVSNDLFWNGPNATANNGGELVQLYAPSTFVSGSSVAHLDEGAHRDALMSPFAQFGQTIHAPTAPEVGMMIDMGWSTSFGASSSIVSAGGLDTTGGQDEPFSSGERITWHLDARTLFVRTPPTQPTADPLAFDRVLLDIGTSSDDLSENLDAGFPSLVTAPSSWAASPVGRPEAAEGTGEQMAVDQVFVEWDELETRLDEGWFHGLPHDGNPPSDSL